jgi:peptide/nickel transport system ATP-binding protein
VGAPVVPIAETRADTVLSVEDLTVEFSTDERVVPAVRGMSFSVERGEVLGIVGESGAGKSATALALMGLLGPSARVGGSVRLHGRELLAMSDERLASLRGRHMALVFQDPTASLNPVHTIGWHLGEAVRAHSRVSRREARDRAVELLQLVGIPEARRRLSSYAHEFSGGMRQRVLIAMAIANDPDVIIADEPTSALDVTVQAQILETLEKAQSETGAAIVLITHDLGVVARAADRVMVMYAGRAVEVGMVEHIYGSPRMPYTMALLRSLPRLDARRKEPTAIPGSPPSPANLPSGCPFSPRCPMSRPACHELEPELLPVDGPSHLSACHFADELDHAVP